MEHALKVLEFESIRERLVDACETPLGQTAASILEPVFNEGEVWSLIGETEEAYCLLAIDNPPSLGAVRDLSSKLNLAERGGVLGGHELFEIGDALRAMREFKAFFARRADAPTLTGYASAMPDLRGLADRLLGDIEPGGDLKDSASPKLSSLRSRVRTLASKVLERVQVQVQRHRDILSDPIYTVRDGRYVIPVRAEHRSKVKGIVHDASGSGQTVYIEPEDVLQSGNQLRAAEGEIAEEVQRILAELSTIVGKHSQEISLGIEAGGRADIILAKAKLAYAMHAVKPERGYGHGIEIQAGKHPLLDAAIAVPTDLSIGFDHKGVLITGPNTGGKTVAIKLVGLFSLMLHCGLFVPATSVRLAPFTQVWADIGDEQSLHQSLSTFSGHIKNIAEALHGLVPGALVLIDEIGAGTDPAEGAALAKAVLAHIVENGSMVLASTHYGELKAFAYDNERFTNASMEFDIKSLRPTYRLLMGSPGGSHALRVASRYGLPNDIVESAKSHLGEAEQEVGSMLAKLDIAQKQARAAQSEADRRQSELRIAETKAAATLAEAEAIKRAAKSSAVAEIENVLREIRLEAMSIFEELRAGGSQDAARKRLNNLMDQGKRATAQLSQQPQSKLDIQEHTFTRGDQVVVHGYSQSGVLLENTDPNHFVVQIGPLKVSVPSERVSRAASPKTDRPRGRGTSDALHRAQTATTEIHLRAKRAEEAMNDLERFIDDAVLGGLHQIRIVHGKGEGILRQLTRQFLRKHRAIASYREGEPAEGGSGVTIAVLK